jgi:acyl carrier protein
MTNTLTQVTQVFQDVFNDNELVVSRATSAKDIPDWDSVMHVSLIIAVEKAFGIRFTSSEVGRLKTVGDLLDLIDSKVAK